ncbi:MAG: ABC transporter ATP-binding protein [Chloroflexi bacterium]|nr:ABC transporter ATP-binding protein [Chloroflexota bacterium]
MMKVAREFCSRFPLMAQGLALVWQAAPGWTIAWALLLLAQGGIPVAQVYLVRTVVNGLAGALRGLDAAGLVAVVWLPAVLLGVLVLAGMVLASLVSLVHTAQAEQLQDHVHGLIHRQALALDLAFYDRPESYDLLHRARVDALSQPIALLESLGALGQSSLTLAGVAVLLVVYTPWLPLMLLGSALPGLWVVARYTRRENKWRTRNTANERRTRYLDWMLTDRGSAAEMRLFALGDYHQSAFQRLRAHLRQGRLTLATSKMKSELAAGAIAWLGGLAGMGWMLLRVVQGLAQLGDLVLCYQAFQQGQGLLRSLLGSAGQIYRSALFLDNLFQFLSLTPSIASSGLLSPGACAQKNGITSADSGISFLRDGVSFEGVTFRYPGSERAALADFSLHLPPDTVTAIVGHNGAGKSTLIKLLCRLYDPQEGQVLLDGRDLRALDPTALRRQVAVLFQEPVRYHATAAENIGMGDLAALVDGGCIREAARAAGSDEIIDRLPRGYETMLGKWFGGTDLSVGEWQRIALARAFLRDAAIIVLDEPTSAMDSWAETDWLGRFRDLAAGRTALMITHRFTTAMHADVIHVMRDGRILESGSHAELVAAGGHYAESWRAQMRESSPV